MNFQEAIDNAYKLYQDTLPYNVEEIFCNPKIDDANETSLFWVQCAALKKFYVQNDALPVAGNIPDMTSTSEIYLRLNQVYHQKANQDHMTFIEMLMAVLGERNINIDSYFKEHPTLIEEDSVTFCKNCKYLNV
jgi:amyloid beta precursor protein binding protein 1